MALTQSFPSTSPSFRRSTPGCSHANCRWRALGGHCGSLGGVIGNSYTRGSGTLSISASPCGNSFCNSDLQDSKAKEHLPLHGFPRPPGRTLACDPAEQRCVAQLLQGASAPANPLDQGPPSRQDWMHFLSPPRGYQTDSIASQIPARKSLARAP